MLDQSFTGKNFLDIFDKENRKGKNLELRFKVDFCESLLKLNEIKNLSNQIKITKDLDSKKILLRNRTELKKERDKIILNILENISERIKKHKIVLVKGNNYGGQSYKFEEKVENFLISKKIQQNIYKTYDVVQSSRYSILCELINLVEDKFPKYIIRTDIKNFYESIPQKILLDKINNDYLLSIKTKDYINQIFESYNSLTGQTNKDTARGIPRGIGISAYLSELFMRKIDNKIRELDDLVYYTRYVDDIIAVFIPNNKNTKVNFLNNYLKAIKKIVNDEGGNGFVLNEEKTKEYNLLNGINSIELEEHFYIDKHFIKKKTKKNANPIQFLGYKFGFIKKSFKTTTSNENKIVYDFLIDLSDKKIIRYKEKIKLSFSHFNNKVKHNRKYAFKLLDARIKYLTSNTKLRNNKDKIFVGIYYSNPFLNSISSLECLQRSLNYYISRTNFSLKEKLYIKKHSFIDGFNYKKFETLPLNNKIYKNHNNVKKDYQNRSNSGIIQFGITEINSIWNK